MQMTHYIRVICFYQTSTGLFVKCDKTIYEQQFIMQI